VPRHPPLARVPVPHHQRAAIAGALLPVPLEVRLDLDLQRFHEHPPRALARQLVERRPRLALRFVPLLDYPQHRRAFPRPCKGGPVGSSQLGKVRHFQFTPIHNSRSYLPAEHAAAQGVSAG